MARLLVFAVDKVNLDDPYRDAWCHKAGDVVIIHPDGWTFAAPERTLPFQIIDLPGIDPAQLSAFTAEDPGDAGQNFIGRRRACSFSLQKWAGIAHVPTVALSVVLGQLKIVKPRLPDPNVLGAAPSVL